MIYFLIKFTKLSEFFFTSAPADEILNFFTNVYTQLIVNLFMYLKQIKHKKC